MAGSRVHDNRKAQFLKRNPVLRNPEKEFRRKKGEAMTILSVAVAGILFIRHD
jgi:hypothetical protein